MSSRRQRSIPLGGRYRQVSLYEERSVPFQQIQSQFTMCQWLRVHIAGIICLIGGLSAQGNQWLGSLVGFLIGASSKVHTKFWSTFFFLNATSISYWYSYKNHIDQRFEYSVLTWWRYQMETFSALLALCAGNSLVTGEFPSQKPVTRSFDVFLNLRLNKRLSKQSKRRWFETPSRPLWRHCNEKYDANTSVRT